MTPFHASLFNAANAANVPVPTAAEAGAAMATWYHQMDPDHTLNPSYVITPYPLTSTF